jgi:hypothetical protein
VGISCLFVGGYILKIPSKGYFEYAVGFGALVFGTCLFIVSLIEPFFKLIYFEEATLAPSNFKKVDVSTHPNEIAVGIDISSQYDIKKIANEIIQKECDLLGRPYCLKIVRKSGLDINESGIIKHLNPDEFVDVEKVVGACVDAYGKPALFTAQVVLAKYPELKSTAIYKTFLKSA